MRINHDTSDNIDQQDQEDILNRNTFENNDLITTDDMDGKVSAILPELSEGQEYAFEKLSDGRTAVVVEEDNVQRCVCKAGETCSMCSTHDKFGRKYTI